MFTDIVGYTALMGKDSEKALELVRQSKEIQKPLVEQHNGKWLKEMGDGAMAKFSTALDAVNCAIEIQRSSRADFEADIRIGIHLGDITIENDDIYGDGVNIASRLESIADPGGIYISDAIEKSIRGQLSLQAKYLGEVKLKNVDYGFRTYALQGVGLPIPEIKKEKEVSGHFVAELNRRGVFRTTFAYLGLGTSLYLLLPLATSIIDIPPWFNPVLFTLLIVGLPISIYLSWAYERSPEGLVRTTSEKSWQNPYSAEQRKPMTGNILITGIWVTALILIVYPKLEKSQLADTIPEGDKTIAVIPFNDLSQNQDQEWFSDGLSEEIINSLFHIDGLEIRGRNSSFAFKGQKLTSKQLADALNVNYIVEGSIRRFNDELRVTVQLIRALDDVHLWSTQYDQKFDDVFQIQSDIANNVARTLNIYLDEGEKQIMFQSGTQNVEAYEAFLKGRKLWDDWHAASPRTGTLWPANQFLDRALELDPTIALAYYYRADAFIHYYEDENHAPVIKDFSQSEARQMYFTNIDAAILHSKEPYIKSFLRFNQKQLADDHTGLSELSEKFIANYNPHPLFSIEFVTQTLSLIAGFETTLEILERELIMYPQHPRLIKNKLEILIYLKRFDLALEARDYLLKTELKNNLSFRASNLVLKLLTENKEHVSDSLLSVEKDNALGLALAGKTFDADLLLTDLAQEEITFYHCWIFWQSGRTDIANDLAAKMDTQTPDYDQITYDLAAHGYHAPFDLDFTPNFKQRLIEAEVDLSLIKPMPIF